MGWPEEGSTFPKSEREASGDTNPWQTLVSQGSPSSTTTLDFLVSIPWVQELSRSGEHQLMATTPRN